MKRFTSILTTLLITALPVGTTVAETPDVQPLLDRGQFGEAKAVLLGHLEQQPGDHDARLALGVTTFLDGIEEFAQTTYSYGVRNFGEDFGMMMPLLAVPVRRNPDPQPVSADDVVAMLERFEEALAEVDDILAPIGDEAAQMPLRIGTVHMDLNGDGELADDEGLWRFYDALTGRQRRWQQPDENDPGVQAKAENFVLGLDTADAYWLRGYCQVMSGVVDVVLAYDGTELFNRTAHLFFEKPETPYPWLLENVQDEYGGFDQMLFLDLIAALHLINQPLRDAERMPAAHAHFMQVIEFSRLSWNSILAETDNQNEWVPGPDQTGAIGINLTQEQIDSWLSFLDEAEAILEGETLLPFWRGTNEKRGINVQKVFTEPTTLDLILWVQGTAAHPYLEEGKLTDPGFWRKLNNDFGRNFPGFAFWIN
ncbi:hypothetical protein [Algisphaera agarilytica]|uniref:Uncharacterized protein n=1 Tax=Algisphaera agarilytica TaxID=1385975 RepID=A0A7X0LKV0_9BACT|nr:hypothetical protein [Algisphaera agarilytica]MBB6430322.1 hypothetical protein [Algisphaera agarilytica]